MELEQRKLRQILEVGIVAARLAGQCAMENLDYAKVSVKNGNEIVTNIDPMCQQMIINRIKESFPDHGFIGEEGDGGQIFRENPRGAEKIWWIIDPIDGTNNYSHGMLLFSVSIGVFYEGEPVVGVIFEPATDCMYTAVKGDDAILNGRRIAVSDDGIDRFSSVGIDSHFDDGVPGWAEEIMRRTRFRNLGSAALHFAYVARGSLAGTVIHVAKLWDIAAGILIASCAGAVVTDWKGKSPVPIDVANYDGYNFPLMLSNKKCHSELLKMLEPFA